jgi:hypothetical protein
VTTPTALILDFGGVLTTNLVNVFTAFSLAEGLHPEALAETSTSNSEGIVETGVHPPTVVRYAPPNVFPAQAEGSDPSVGAR